jgi:hypothetical protein
LGLSGSLSTLLSILILSATPSAPIDDRAPDAVEVFHCGFEPSSDEDYDAWPDRWTRRRGPDYPTYLPVQISEESSPEGSYCLRTSLNGGAIAVASPAIEIGSIFSYVLEGYLKIQGLEHDVVYLSISFFDAHGQLVGSTDSEHFTTAGSWTKVRVGPLSAPSDKVQTAVIELHVEPHEGADLHGSIWFDDIWLGRLPRIALSTNSMCNVYSADSAPPEVNCQVSGILERDPVMMFELLDCSSQSLSQKKHRLDGQVLAQKSSKASTLLGTTITKNVGFAGAARWSPPIKEPGYYRVRVTMSGSAGLILEREIALAILPQQAAPAHGEFGWSLPAGDRPLSLAALGQLLPQVGINWIKFPVWSRGSGNEQLDQTVAFAERLSRRGVEMVAVLDKAPPEIQSQLNEGPVLSAADVFSAAHEVWYPSLEPIMTRLSLQVKWWQLGLDDDVSFVGYPNLPKRIAEVKKQLRQFGQKIHLGFGWQMINEPQQAGPDSWDFTALAAKPQLTDAEIGAYLPAQKSGTTRRWLSIEPLPRAVYSMETRATDLIHRMIAGRIQGADAIFVSHPFDDQCGLMNADGSPSELFLPWRTTAAALAGSQYLGSLKMPSGSPNHVFARGSQVVVVVWNTTPTREAIYLGEEARQIDVWGRSMSPASASEQTFEVGPLPTFIINSSEPIVRWNLGFAFAQPKMASLFGVTNENEFIVKNYFPQGVGGEIRLLTPDSWKTYPRITRFKLAAGEELHQPFSVVLPFDASAGRHDVRVEVIVNGERSCQFTIYRSLEVGLGDVELEVASRLNAQGELEVEQKFTNHTLEPVSFKCMLFAPERRRLVGQVIRLGQGTETKVYRFPNGQDLVGKTLFLRAEEINGQRILNQRFVAEE